MFKRILISLIILQLTGVSSCYALNNSEWDYRSKVYQDEAKVRYEKKLMPESGYMTVEEYEKKSAAKDKSQGDGDFVPKVKDSKMKYVPQPHYKLVRYNNPPGTVELNLHRKVHFDKQEVMPGLISPDVSLMLIPIVSYYTKAKSTDCDIYTIPLRKGMPDVEKVIKANFAAKSIKPIVSTDRTLIEYGTFRTLTPVDFSADARFAIIKEKTGNVEDGIWQTELIIYDFMTKKATKLNEIREAIRYYWRTTKNLDLKEFRWDIYPLGFDINNPTRVLVAAYAFAGNPPRCLGTWSIDVIGKQTHMESLTDDNISVSTIGLKIVEDGIVDPESVEAEVKLAEKYEKQEEKDKKRIEKEKKKQLKKEYKEEVKEIKRNFNELKKDDNSKDSRSDRVHKYIPFYKVKGGKLTGADSLK